MRYRIEARVTDAGNREISGHNSVIATCGSFAVGISPDNYFFQKGQKMNATVVAKDYDGKPIHTRVRVETVKYNYASGHTNEIILDTVGASETAADGTARVSLTAKDSGGLTLKVIATTPEKSRSQRHRLDLGCGCRRSRLERRRKQRNSSRRR